MIPSRLLQQPDQLGGFVAGKAIFNNRGQGLFLVARRQPGQLPADGDVDQPQLEMLQHFIAELFHQPETPAHKALVTIQQRGDLDLAQMILPV